MNRDDTRALLKARSALTSQPYGDDAIDAWHDALGEWTLDQCRTALIRTAREHQKITVAHIVDQLPKQARRPATTPEECELCDDTGWVDDPGYHSKTCKRQLGCPCHGVKPCRCTRGQQMVETQRKITQANR